MLCELFITDYLCFFVISDQSCTAVTGKVTFRELGLLLLLLLLLLQHVLYMPGFIQCFSGNVLQVHCKSVFLNINVWNWGSRFFYRQNAFPVIQLPVTVEAPRRHIAYIDLIDRSDCLFCRGLVMVTRWRSVWAALTSRTCRLCSSSWLKHSSTQSCVSTITACSTTSCRPVTWHWLRYSAAWSRRDSCSVLKTMLSVRLLLTRCDNRLNIVSRNVIHRWHLPVLISKSWRPLGARSAFIAWAEWTLAVVLPWWQNYRDICHLCCYYRASSVVQMQRVKKQKI